jgi:hypothetical protein
VRRRYRPEADQVREDRERLDVAIDPVARADLAVAVAICGVGELERDVRVLAVAVEL